MVRLESSPISLLDGLVLLLTACVIGFAVYQGQEFDFTKQWTHGLGHTLSRARHFAEINDAAHQLPLPLVTDIDGDGLNELVLVTKDPSIKILRCVQGSTETAPGEALQMLKEQSLLSSLSLRIGRQPIAVATGYIQRFSSTELRQMVIVVVTEGWAVICFDHNLNKMWEKSVTVHHPHGMYLGEIAILITSHRVQTKDIGLVVIGGKMVPVDFIGVKNAGGTVTDKNEEMFRTADQYDDEQVETEEDDGTDGSIESPKFVYYGFEGFKGAVRWIQDPFDELEQFEETQSLNTHNVLQPQHLDTYNVDWIHYIYSLIEQLPHLWLTRRDTQMKLIHLTDKHKPGRTSASTTTPDPLFGQSQSRKTDAGVPEPNAIVIHQSDGIEVIHLYTGTRICKLPLDQGMLYADVNNDGVVDSVFGIGQRDTDSQTTPLTSEKYECVGFAMSGLPPHHILFNSSLCAKRNLNKGVKNRGNKADVVPQFVAPPLAHMTFRAPITIGTQGSFIHSIRSKATEKPLQAWATVFLLSNGMVVSIAHDGERRWSAQTRSDWSDGSPTQKRIALYSTEGDEEDIVVVLGSKTLTLLWLETGSVAQTVEIADIGSGDLVVADFNNDGLNDLIIVTSKGYFGFASARQVGALLLVGLFLVVMLTSVIIFAFVVAMDDDDSAFGWRSRSSPAASPTPVMSSSTEHDNSWDDGNTHSRNWDSSWGRRTFKGQKDI